MSFRALLLIAFVQSAIVLHRTTAQSIGGTSVPSATPSMLAYDPTGKAALLTALGDSGGYVNGYPYQFTSDILAVSADIDPGNGIPKNGTAAEFGSFAVVGDFGSAPVHAIPFGNDLLLLVWRASNLNGTSFNSMLAVADGQYSVFAATFNMTTKELTPYSMPEHPFCGGHLLLPDGENALIVGGEPLQLNPPHLINGIQHIRVFDSISQEYKVVATMEHGRWYPTVMTLEDGNILILGGSQQEAGGFGADAGPSDTDHPSVSCKANAGGTGDPLFANPTFQIFYPANNTFSPSLALTILLRSWPINLYCYAIQLPVGSTLITAGSLMQALYFTPEGATVDESVGKLPDLPITVNFPQYNTMALLPLEPPNYDSTVLLAGGSSHYCANANSPASKESYLVDVTPGADHSLNIEALHFPRIGGDLVILPDGTLLLCNGFQVGQSNGGGPNASAGNIGTTQCELYDPTKPVGKRWSLAADSAIWRGYHSWTFLTKNATVWVGGSDVTAERRLQEWTPPYLANGKPRPSISNVPESLTYGENFTFSFSGVPTIDRVVLNRVAGATHGSHFDQRQIVLVNSTSGSSPPSGTVSTASVGDGSTVSSAAPTNSSVAPPGLYYLFALNEGVPSVAEFVLLEPEGGTPRATLKAGQSVFDNLPNFLSD